MQRLIYFVKMVVFLTQQEATQRMAWLGGISFDAKTDGDQRKAEESARELFEVRVIKMTFSKVQGVIEFLSCL